MAICHCTPRYLFYTHHLLSILLVLRSHLKEANWGTVKGMVSTTEGGDLSRFHSRFLAIMRTENLVRRKDVFIVRSSS